MSMLPTANITVEPNLSAEAKKAFAASVKSIQGVFGSVSQDEENVYRITYSGEKEVLEDIKELPNVVKVAPAHHL